LIASIEQEKDEQDLSSYDTPSFSISSNTNNRTPELGKNTYDVKVWIAKLMKNDLQQLADETNLKLSHFIREIIISSLFGHTYLPEREKIILLRVEIERRII